MMNEVRNLLIGFELGEKESQITCYDRKRKEPVSVSTRTGTNLFFFPTAVARKNCSDEWYFGREAEYFSSRKEAALVTDLFDLLKRGDSADVGGKVYTAEQLLAAFFREALKLLGVTDPVRCIAGICVTTGELTGRLASEIRSALAALGLPPARCFVQDSLESFYYYGYSQKPEISVRGMALIRFRGDTVTYQRMDEHRSRKPFTVTITEPERLALEQDPLRRDGTFAAAVDRWTGAGGLSGIFITGDGFSQDWAKRSVRALSARGAKVFEGGNLFVKGACWTVLERLERHAFRRRVYLGPDIVRSSLCIDLIDGSGQTVYPLIRAGVNWFENESVCEIIPDGRKDLVVTVISMDGTQHRNERYLPDGLPDRPNRATRLRLAASCIGTDEARLEVTDLGFGEWFPSSGKRWTYTVPLAFSSFKAKEGASST